MNFMYYTFIRYYRLLPRVPGLMAILLLAAGCAARTNPTVPPDTLDGMRVMPVDAPPASVAAGMDGDTLYRLMLAEIAGQRDQLDVAVENYLEVARVTRDPDVIERAIRIAVHARDDDAAAEVAQLWLQISPDNSDAHQVLAAVAIRNDDVDKAVRHLGHIIDQGSDQSQVSQRLWLIANMLGREKNHATALAVMERLVADYRDNADALFAYAHVAVRLDDLERAEALFERILELQPDNINAVMNYVSLLQKQGDRQTALNWLDENLDRFGDNFNLRLVYARLLTDDRQFESAREEFRQLAEEAPDNADVIYSLGLLSLQSNQLDEAEHYFSRMLEIGQRQHESRYYLGRIAEERGELDSAGDYYTSVDGGDNYLDAQIRRGLILAKQDQVDAALAHLEGIETDDQSGRQLLIQAEAEILMRQERLAEAMEIYNRALAETPDDTNLLYNRAMLAEKMDKLELLERDLRRILEQDPDHAQALNALGYTLADRTDRLEEAYKLIERALELSPNDFYILDSMGWVLYRMGRLDEAETYLRRALEMRNDPEVAAHLGEVLWVKGEREAAREVWETALQTTPDDERLLDVIKRFKQ